MKREEIVQTLKKKIEEYYQDLKAGKVVFVKPESEEEKHQEKEKEKGDEEGKKKGKKK